jgi:hypothetical protein
MKHLKEETLQLKEADYDLQGILDVLCTYHGSEFKTLLINPRNKKYREDFVILLNGLRCDLHQKIKSGDIISFLPILAGG